MLSLPGLTRPSAKNWGWARFEVFDDPKPLFKHAVTRSLIVYLARIVQCAGFEAFFFRF